MKIAILSDLHDHWPNMTPAIAIVNRAGCEVLLHAGDLITPTGVHQLSPLGFNRGELLNIC